MSKFDCYDAINKYWLGPIYCCHRCHSAHSEYENIPFQVEMEGDDKTYNLCCVVNDALEEHKDVDSD